MLSWAFNFLYDFSLGNSDILQLLLIEIDNISSSDSGYTPTLNDLITKMPLLTQVIKETLRFSPTCSTFIRFCKKSMNLGGEYAIKEGEVIIVSTIGTHLHPSCWENPKRFDPSRFDQPVKPYSYFPTNIVASSPGQVPEFTLLFGRIALFTMLCNFSFTNSPMSNVKPDEGLFLFPSGNFFNFLFQKTHDLTYFLYLVIFAIFTNMEMCKQACCWRLNREDH